MLKNELLKGGLVALTGTYIASQFFPIEVSGMISSITSNTIFLAGIGSCALGSFGLWLQTKDSVEKIIHQVFKHTGPAIQVGKTYLYPRLVQKRGWITAGISLWTACISDIDIFEKYRDLEIATNLERRKKMAKCIYISIAISWSCLVEGKDIPDGIKSFSRV